MSSFLFTSCYDNVMSSLTSIIVIRNGKFLSVSYYYGQFYVIIIEQRVLKRRQKLYFLLGNTEIFSSQKFVPIMQSVQIECKISGNFFFFYPSLWRILRCLIRWSCGLFFTLFFSLFKGQEKSAVTHKYHINYLSNMRQVLLSIRH